MRGLLCCCGAKYDQTGTYRAVPAMRSAPHATRSYHYRRYTSYCPVKSHAQGAVISNLMPLPSLPSVASPLFLFFTSSSYSLPLSLPCLATRLDAFSRDLSVVIWILPRHHCGFLKLRRPCLAKHRRRGDAVGFRPDKSPAQRRESSCTTARYTALLGIHYSSRARHSERTRQASFLRFGDAMAQVPRRRRPFATMLQPHSRAPWR